MLRQLGWAKNVTLTLLFYNRKYLVAVSTLNMPKTESVIAWEVEEGVDVVDSVVAGEGDHQ